MNTSSEGTAPPPTGTEAGMWIGYRLLRGGKGYAPTPMGGVHYRLVGPAEGIVVMLLHQTPWSMIQYGEVQDALAARNVRSLAIDTPGYGMSDAPDFFPTIADYADNLRPVLDHLGIASVVAAGHHTGAAVATAFAARFPQRTRGLVLHGPPFYSAEERAAKLASPRPAPAVRFDGSHLSDYFNVIRPHAGQSPATAITATWSVFGWFQSGVSDVGHEVAFHNDLARDLARTNVPTLILSDTADTLHANAVRAAQACPHTHYVQFSEGGAHGLMLEPTRWAQTVADFIGAIDQPGPR